MISSIPEQYGCAGFPFSGNWWETSPVGGSRAPKPAKQWTRMSDFWRRKRIRNKLTKRREHLRAVVMLNDFTDTLEGDFIRIRSSRTEHMKRVRISWSSIGGRKINGNSKMHLRSTANIFQKCDFLGDFDSNQLQSAVSIIIGSRFSLRLIQSIFVFDRSFAEISQ